ncbi:MAG: nicotinate (nicotinamide) nucleotide adenylyltransferase [Oscillospiraceae bacterium]|nr:nicotinate (nicotinamide) nucleotide adenylyltransferase [Oscillospiraceae bacterium]
MKLLLFGGTFDPPHKGHISLLKNAIAAVQPDKVLVIPAADPPHKAAAQTSGQLRFAMCECFLSVDARVALDDMEIKRGGKSYTYDTVCALRKKWPDAQIFMIMGSDMLLYFKKWYRYEDLLHMVTLVCQNRAPQDVPQVYRFRKQLEEEGADILLCENAILEISSTEIRSLYAQGQNIGALVPADVEQIINKNRLYKAQSIKESTEI